MLYKSKPISPGSRFYVKIKRCTLYNNCSFKQLTVAKKKFSGRNNLGHIVVRHRGGGHKKNYRLIDFNRLKVDIEGYVERIEYDPNRTAYIALILYKDGIRNYIISPNFFYIGMKILSSFFALPIRLGNCMPLKYIPIGTVIHNVECYFNGGGQIARSAGTSVSIIGLLNRYALIRLKSGEIRKVLSNYRAVVGSVSNFEHSLVSVGKAGRNRWKGKRPTVRGVAMNPVDHPHGGGEGKTSGGRHPVSPWGFPTKGKKTVKKFIII